MEDRKFTIPEIIGAMGWTQDDVAKMLECSRSTVSRKMSGESEWTSTDIRIILGASRMTLKQLEL